MADPVGGAVIGLVFTEFWAAVKEAKDRSNDFKPKLRDLERILRGLVPVVEDIERINIQLNESDQCEIDYLYSIMQEGKKLVSKSIGISWWNFIKRSYYQKKLVDLENKITRFSNTHIQLRMYREVKYLRLRVNELQSINELEQNRPQMMSLQKLGSGMVTVPNCGYFAGSFARAPIWPSTFSTSICSELGDFSNLDLSYPRPFAPPQVPRAPPIGIFGLIFLLFVPSEADILKVIAIIVIIFEGIMSKLEKSESGIWMVIKDVGMLKTTTEQLDATMRSLVHVLEEIESNREQLLMNEKDRIEASKSLRSLMTEGQKLACESSYGMVWWNFVKKWKYQKMMAELDNKLLRIRSLYLQARLAKNIEDRQKMEGRHRSTGRHESYSMLNNNVNPYQDRQKMEGRHTSTRRHESYSMLNNNVNLYQDRQNMEGRHTSTRRHESYSMLNNNVNPYQQAQSSVLIGMAKRGFHLRLKKLRVGGKKVTGGAERKKQKQRRFVLGEKEISQFTIAAVTVDCYCSPSLCSHCSSPSSSQEKRTRKL